MKFGSKWLRIIYTAPSKSESCIRQSNEGDATGSDAAIYEEDEEALRPSTQQPQQPLVVYDIVHSSSYQVPVLYVTFKNLPYLLRGLPPPDSAYEMLVPLSFRPQIDSIGPMGALSMTDHPITSTPAYFVHPCRTAEAMKAVMVGKEIRPGGYLLQWMGIIGQSVGLGAPLEFAQALIRSNDG